MHYFNKLMFAINSAQSPPPPPTRKQSETSVQPPARLPPPHPARLSSETSIKTFGKQLLFSYCGLSVNAIHIHITVKLYILPHLFDYLITKSL